MTEFASITRPKMSTFVQKPSLQTKPMPPFQKSYFESFFLDFICGAGSGAITGAMVAPAEYLKVVKQTGNPNFRLISRWCQIHRNMVGSIPSFSAIFSMVCAIEFSVNQRIKHDFGNSFGILASAITGSSFLTVADHLMLRREKGQSFRGAIKSIVGIKWLGLWTGFTPMICREAAFITSVMHLGPMVGQWMQSSSNSDRQRFLYTSLGRLCTGIVTTFISQPFDSLARQMQKSFLVGGPTGWIDCIWSMLEEHRISKSVHRNVWHPLKAIENELAKLEAGKSNGLWCSIKGMRTDYKNSEKREWHPIFRGSFARIGLATCGGVLAGGCFDLLKSSFGMGNQH